MNKLIIVTGASGTGKTTIAKKLNQEILNSILLSFDELKINSYDLVGFNTQEEKDKLNEINKEYFISLLTQLVYRKETIIVEFPFSSKWKIIFDNLVKESTLEVKVLNVYAKNFDTLWKRLEDRDNSKERHPSHSLKQYSKKDFNKYKSTLKLDYNTLKKEYLEEKYTSLGFKNSLNVKDIELLDIEGVLKFINT